jgi:hypothetical protein
LSVINMNANFIRFPMVEISPLKFTYAVHYVILQAFKWAASYYYYLLVPLILECAPSIDKFLAHPTTKLHWLPPTGQSLGEYERSGED